MIVSREQFAWHNNQPPHGHRPERRSNRQPVPDVVTSLSPWQTSSLDKSMLDDSDTYAPVSVGPGFVANDGAFDRSRHSFKWSTEQTHDKTDSGRKLHAPWQPQVNTRSADVVELTVETERLIIDVDAPNSRRECSIRTRFSAPLSHGTWGPKTTIRDRKMAIEYVISSLFAVHIWALSKVGEFRL